MHTERAIDELRRQMGIVLHEEGGHAIANYPAEFIDETLLSHLRSPSLSLLITAARAKMLGLPEHDLKIEADGLSLAQIQMIYDPLSAPVPLPKLVHRQATAVDSMALKLAKYAALLPALLLTSTSKATQDWLKINVSDVRHTLSNPETGVLKTATANLPIEGAEKATLTSFRSKHSTSVHLALVIGNSDNKNSPLTRIHSSCVTGDILGSASPINYVATSFRSEASIPLPPI